MAAWDDVRRIALALPEADERLHGDGMRQWRVRDKLFVWERPLRPKEIEELVTEAWLVRAPKRLTEAYLGDQLA